MALDLVSVSYDGKSLLVGGCKWSAVRPVEQERLRAATLAKAELLPFYEGHEVEVILFCRGGSKRDWVIGPGVVLAGLMR